MRNARKCSKTHELEQEDVDGRCPRWGILPPRIWWECSKKGDHTEFMVLALQRDDVYGESILGFASQTVLPGERIALMAPTLVSS